MAEKRRFFRFSHIASLIYYSLLDVLTKFQVNWSTKTRFIRIIVFSYFQYTEIPRRKCQKMELFRIFLGISSLLFSETLHLIRAFNSEKNGPKSRLGPWAYMRGNTVGLKMFVNFQINRTKTFSFFANKLLFFPFSIFFSGFPYIESMKIQ